MKPYYCFDDEYNEIDTTLDEFDRLDQARFLYIEDFDETIEIFTKLGVNNCGLDDEQGGFVFDDNYISWMHASNDENDKLYEMVFDIENKRESAVKVGEPIPKKPETILYDLFITATGWDEEIQSNSQPITFDEVLEALTLLRKPCLFGDAIKEYRVVKHKE